MLREGMLLAESLAPQLVDLLAYFKALFVIAYVSVCKSELT